MTEAEMSLSFFFFLCYNHKANMFPESKVNLK